MRYESSVTSLSWIPSEAVPAGMRMPFDAGILHYDTPPPDHIEDVAALRAADRFRFGNVLRAWITTGPDGTITGYGYGGDGPAGGFLGATTVRLGALHRAFQATQLPDLRRTPEEGPGWVRFSQTVGGRAAIPTPRTVPRAPYVQWQAPLVWTTLTLTLHAGGPAGGRAEYAMTGASPFPRHWGYDEQGRLTHKSGLTDPKSWTRESFGRHTPWGDQDSGALVTAVETALERTLSGQLMQGAAKPKIAKVAAGTVLLRQGEPGTAVYLLLDGVVGVERDGQALAEYGPGVMLGERALLEDGNRTSTVTAVTACRVASAEASQFDRAALAELATGHQKESGGTAREPASRES